MQCYYVLVHGILDWTVESQNGGSNHPAGFYCHRYVLAGDEGKAVQIAFGRIRANLAGQFGWMESTNVTLTLNADEVRIAGF